MANNCCTMNVMRLLKTRPEEPESPCATCGVRYSAVWECEATTLAYCSNGVLIIHNRDATPQFPDRVSIVPWPSILAAKGEYLFYIEGSEQIIGEYTGHVS